MFDVSGFRAYMKNLIGDATQQDFALERGISPVHLSRMMRAERPNRPSTTTLKKISGNSQQVYEELLSLCGYSDSAYRTIEEIQKEDAGRRIDELRGSFSDMTKNVRVYGSVDEFFDEYIMLYDTMHAAFKKGKKTEYDDGGHFGAEYSMVFTAKYTVRDNTCTIYAVLYFSETRGGKVVVLDFALDGRSLVRAGAVRNSATAAQAEKLPYLYVMRSNRTAEERLLEKLFGKSSDEIVVSEIGFGISFVDGSFSADAIRGFVSRHSGSYGDEESEYLKRIADGEDPAEVLSGYNDTEDIGSGFGSLVAKAMREETGINFVFYHNVREEKDALSAVIVNRDEYQNYDLEELKKFSRGYAEELGLAEYGECVVYVYQFIDSDMRFSVDTEERKEQ